MISRLIALSAIAVPALTLAASNLHSLRFEPAEGWTAVYSQKITVTGSTPIEAETKVKRTIMSVETDGSWVEQTMNLEAFIRTATAEARDERPQERMTRYDSHGSLREILSGNSDIQSYRQGLLTRLIAPPKSVEVDEVWRYERTAGRPTGLPEIHIRYRLRSVLGEASRRHYVVSFTYTEASGTDPMSATGTFTLNQRYEPTEIVVQVENYLGEAGATAQIRIVRLE